MPDAQGVDVPTFVPVSPNIITPLLIFAAVKFASTEDLFAILK
jgi:hypothetical protein